MVKAFPSNVNDQTKGMDLRDYFAGQALAGLMANETTTSAMVEVEPDHMLAANLIGFMAYKYADAMLAARKEQHANT